MGEDPVLIFKGGIMDRSAEDVVNQLAFVTGQLMGLLHSIDRDEEVLKYLMARGYSKEGIKLIYVHLKVMAETFYK